MSSSDFLKSYDLAEGTMRGLYDSRIRLAILDALGDKPMRLADLRRVVDASAPNTSANAKELEDMGLVERVEGDFALTSYGKAARRRAQESFEFYATYEKFKEFWTVRKRCGIPDFLWARLGELENSVLRTAKEGNIDAVNETFQELFGSIKERFYAVTPILRKEWWDIGSDSVKSGVDTHVILTPELLKHIVEMVPVDELRPLDDVPNLRWSMLGEPCSAAFVVSEKSFSMVMEHKEGGYSLNMELDSRDPRAVKWGMDLFEHYKKKAKPFKLSDYL